MDRPGVRQVPEGSGEQGEMEKSGCKIICGAPTTLAVKGLMMMMMMMMMMIMMMNVNQTVVKFSVAVLLYHLGLIFLHFVFVGQGLIIHVYAMDGSAHDTST